MSTQPLQPEPSLADVAAEPIEESVEREGDVVGDHPDTAGTVAEDDAQ